MFQRWRDPADAWLLEAVRATAATFQQLGIQAVANDWLLRQDWKRVLAYLLYHDLLAEGASRKRILEVGGGLSTLTEQLARRHDYSLIELATHEAEENYRKLEAHLGRSFVTLGDWSEVRLQGDHDLVIANDLFPNVDQRLYQLVSWAWSHCRELRMTLTYYEDTVWKVRRIPSGEQLTVCPWGLREVRAFLEHLQANYPEHCSGWDQGQLVYQSYQNVLFTNARNILVLRLTKEAPG
jgi:hypothetical protein